MTDSKMLDAALSYAARGLLVTHYDRLKGNSPEPRAHGFKDATTDEAQQRNGG